MKEQLANPEGVSEVTVVIEYFMVIVEASPCVCMKNTALGGYLEANTALTKVLASLHTPSYCIFHTKALACK